jgi:hypothetical protein
MARITTAITRAAPQRPESGPAIRGGPARPRPHRRRHLTAFCAISTTATTWFRCSFMNSGSTGYTRSISGPVEWARVRRIGLALLLVLQSSDLPDRVVLTVEVVPDQPLADPDFRADARERRWELTSAMVSIAARTIWARLAVSMSAKAFTRAKSDRMEPSRGRISCPPDRTAHGCPFSRTRPMAEAILSRAASSSWTGRQAILRRCPEGRGYQARSRRGRR